MGSRNGLQGTRPAAAAVHGILPAAEPSPLDFPMHTSDRSVSHPCSARVSATSRTAVYGPVRTVVWEGRSREAPPYPDPWPITSISQFGPGPLLVEPDMTGQAGDLRRSATGSPRPPWPTAFPGW